MATQVQFRGGTTSEHSSFNGVAKEVTVDTTKQTLVVQDGSTNGGFPLLRENGTQSLITTGNISIDSDSSKLKLGADDDLEIYHDGSHSYIKDAGTGNLKVQANSSIVTASDKVQFESADQSEVLAAFYENDRCELYYDGSKQVQTFSSGLNWQDNKKAEFGNSGDLKLYHNGSNSYISHSNTGNLYIMPTTGDIIFDNGSGELARITQGGDIELPDNGEFRAGTGDDLKIYHDGTDSYIYSNNKTLYLNANGSTISINPVNSENSAKFLANGAVELYYDDSKKLETYSHGVKVYNHLRVQGANDENAVINLYADNGDDAADLWQVAGMTGGTFEVNQWNGGSWENCIKATGGGAVELYYDGSKKFETTSTGASMDGLLNFNNTGDKLLLPDSGKIVLGGGLDLQIYFDGSNSYIKEPNAVSGQFIIDSWNGTDIRQGETGDVMIRASGGGAVNLYYDGGNPKLYTTSVGAQIDGRLVVNNSGYGALIVMNNDDSADGAYISLINDSASPADNDVLGLVNFKGKDSAGNDTAYANIRGISTDVTDGSESGEISFRTRHSGTFAERLKIASDGTIKATGTATGTNVNTGDAGTYLQLQNLSTNANTFTVLQGVDGSGQGTSQIAFVNLVDAENKGQMVFSTRPANGTMTSALTLDSSQNATFAGTVTCTSLTETSDIALKTNIEPITNVLDKINQITGYKYDFTKSNSSSMGVIAQDVEKVFPELVHGEEGSKSLQYSGLIGALIESVKELSAKVAALESS